MTKGHIMMNDRPILATAYSGADVRDKAESYVKAKKTWHRLRAHLFDDSHLSPNNPTMFGPCPIYFWRERTMLTL